MCTAIMWTALPVEPPRETSLVGLVGLYKVGPMTVAPPVQAILLPILAASRLVKTKIFAAPSGTDCGALAVLTYSLKALSN